jgi:hypothetical protein
MSYSFTTTSTFTRTHASYLASKIAGDLHQMQLFYGIPSDKKIEAYLEEVIIFLLKDYLGSVAYGFKKGDEWVIALKYSVGRDGVITADDRSGRVTPGIDITGAQWYSFLSYSATYDRATASERESVMALNPIKRTDGQEPRVGGVWSSDKTYSNGGVSLNRQSFSKF